MSFSSSAIRLNVEPLRTLAAGGIGVDYTLIGSRLNHPVRLIILMNLTDARLLFSFDGVTDHLVLPENSNTTLDIAANRTSTTGWFMGEKRGIWVKRDQNPTAGSVYLTVFFGGNE